MRFLLVLLVLLSGAAQAQVARLEIGVSPQQAAMDGASVIQVTLHAFDAMGTALTGAPLALGATGGQFQGAVVDHGDGSYTVGLVVPGADFQLPVLEVVASLADGSLPVRAQVVVLKTSTAAPAPVKVEAGPSPWGSSPKPVVQPVETPAAQSAEQGTAPAGETVPAATPKPRTKKRLPAQKSSPAMAAGQSAFPPVLVSTGPRALLSAAGQRLEARIGFIFGGFHLLTQPCDPDISTGCGPVSGAPEAYHFIAADISAPDAPALSLAADYFPLRFLGPYLRWSVYGYSTGFDIVTDEGKSTTFGDGLQHLSAGAQGQVDVLRERLYLRLRLGLHVHNTMVFRRIVVGDALVPRYERLWLKDLDVGLGVRLHLFEPLWVRADYDLFLSAEVGGVVAHTLDLGASYTLWKGLFVEAAFDLWTRGFFLKKVYQDPVPQGFERAEQRGKYGETNAGFRVGVGYRL